MDFLVTAQEKSYLLALARATIAAEWDPAISAPTPPRKEASGSTALDQRCGAFVTLHKGGELRGCIGTMIGRQPLTETVRAMARAAAFEDPRFPPLGREELARCEMEISILSPMVPCPDPRTVVVGVHGVYLTRSGRSGVFLPQVPGEQGWDRDQYLEHLCRKAGLPPRSYEEPDAQLFTFTAVVFSD